MVSIDELFKTINITKEIIDGQIIELPIRYYKSKGMLANFLAPTKFINDELPTKKLIPLQVFPGLSVVSFIAFQHFDTSIGPFRELHIAIPVFLNSKFSLPFISLLNYKKNVKFGVYMCRLFVSTEKALVAGIKVWNYPKVVTDISFIEDELIYQVAVKKDDNYIVSLCLYKKSFNGRKQNLETDFFVYSIKNNEILKSTVNWKSTGCHRMLSTSVSFKIGDHSLSDQISKFNLKKICVEGRYYNEVKYILNPPQEKHKLK